MRQITIRPRAPRIELSPGMLPGPASEEIPVMPSWRYPRLVDATASGDVNGILQSVTDNGTAWSVTIAGEAVACPDWDDAAWWSGPLLGPDGAQLTAWPHSPALRTRVKITTASVGLDIYAAVGICTSSTMAAGSILWGGGVAAVTSAISRRSRASGLSSAGAWLHTTSPNGSTTNIESMLLATNSAASSYSNARSIFYNSDGSVVLGNNAGTATASIGNGPVAAVPLYWVIAVGRTAGAGGTSPDTIAFDPRYLAVRPTPEVF